VQLTMFDVQEKPDLSKCSLVYEPRGRAREYAALACNVYSGCDHGCVYCYAPNAVRKQRPEFSTSSRRKNGFLKRLEREAAKYQAAGVHEQVLLSFTCDPYQHLDVAKQVTRQVIKVLHHYGLPVCILTKGGSRALRDWGLLDDRDAFASTLTCLDDSESLKWEPNAALPSDRIATLRKFHNVGIPTWVSLEPVLNPDVALEIIHRTHEFVDLYKVGKLNYHPLANTIDWATFGHQAIELLEGLGKDYYIKKDLAQYQKPHKNVL
jgi:DNA repair photolyase